MATLADESVDCCVTSPPYYGLRDYGVDGQIGLESSPEEYVSKLVGVFREVRRVLKPEGTLWLNLGDSFAASGYSNHKNTGGAKRDDGGKPKHLMGTGLKPKDLIGIPWMVAFALRTDGWYLRSDIIWHKPNCMPESVTDRPTKAHEYLFLLSKGQRYYYDAEAIKEDAVSDHKSGNGFKRPARVSYQNPDGTARGNDNQWDEVGGRRNARTVWTIPTKPFPEAHFATFPEKLVEPCILAGCTEGGAVLDPFFGAGTVGAVAKRLGRKYIGIELNPEYIEIAKKRISEITAPLGAIA